MRHSRYLSFVMIIMSCLVIIIAWKSPQKVVSTMVQPQFADSQRVVVQRFWDCLDNRQLDLVDQFISGKEISPMGKHEIENWKSLVEKNPLLSLQKLEFLSSSTPEAVVIRVSWTSPLKENVTATYSMETRSTSSGWKISQIQKITPQSMANLP